MQVIFKFNVYNTGIYVNEKYGGSGLGRLEASLIFEGLATGCVGSSAYISIHNMCCWMIDTYGTEEQKIEWLPKLTTLEYNSSYCLTEPNSGSDALALKTTAKEEGDYYILNGTKAFISGKSDLYLIMCRTGEKEISCIAVQGDTPGLSLGKNEEKMGWNVQPTQMVILENCKVPKKNIIGKPGQGFKIAMSGLDGGRINIASCSLGGAAFALDATIQYTKSRKAFGKAIADFQNTQFKIAEMATILQASRLITRNAAISIDNKVTIYH